jgi:sensor domain CHASE-containing protein
VAQHINENMRRKAAQACRGETDEAKARKLLERGIMAASTGPSVERQQVKTFEAFQAAYLAEHGEAPGPMAIAEFYTALAKASK